jgi:molybdopterin synthase catalytic subunit
MSVVVSIAQHRNHAMKELFQALSEYAETGEAVGFCGAVRWADGREQMFVTGAYEDTAQAIKAASKMTRDLLEDTRF